MKRFEITGTFEEDDNPFDRQERIPWWSQQRIGDAKVMVAGAGAIGNETLKNLALLGFRNIFIADFDTISASNLSRTVLFRPEDKGRRKAEVAAERTRELCLAESPRVDWFDGDVVWDLGTGVFREMDVVLGCLDNVETRFAVNRQCWLAQTPWIDAGIFELAGGVSVYMPGRPPCYQCGATPEQIKAARQRYSCDDYKREVVAAGRVPTVQVASAIASALQVQEAAKLICGQPVAEGKKVFFQGMTNDFVLLNLTPNPACTAHATCAEVSPVPLGSDATVREFLEVVSRDEHSGAGARLDLRGDRTFLLSAPCVVCGRAVELLKPAFRLYRHEVVCPDCYESGAAAAEAAPARQVAVDLFSLADTEERLLSLTLREIGVPRLHVVA
ncbi:MAG TPA: ThiF family adenylyltransferase, partial [Pyrinomonadaceae bacterium]|nr:ThiF family adenylyltransferase [Pyrinomonadaceae bacterium]